MAGVYFVSARDLVRIVIELDIIWMNYWIATNQEKKNSD